MPTWCSVRSVELKNGRSVVVFSVPDDPTLLADVFAGKSKGSAPSLVRAYLTVEVRPPPDGWVATDVYIVDGKGNLVKLGTVHADGSPRSGYWDVSDLYRMPPLGVNTAILDSAVGVYLGEPLTAQATLCVSWGW